MTLALPSGGTIQAELAQDIRSLPADDEGGGKKCEHASERAHNGELSNIIIPCVRMLLRFSVSPRALFTLSHSVIIVGSCAVPLFGLLDRFYGGSL